MSLSFIYNSSFISAIMISLLKSEYELLLFELILVLFAAIVKKEANLKWQMLSSKLKSYI